MKSTLKYLNDTAIKLCICLTLSLAFFCLPSCSSVKSVSPGVASNGQIWYNGNHSAFTSIVKFNGEYYVSFREAGSHIFDEDGQARGKIRVLASKDGKDWKSVALIGKEGFDLRDPKLSVTPDGRLMVLIGGSVYVDRKLVARKPQVCLSPDGRHFPDLQQIEFSEGGGLNGQEWPWRVTWHKGTGYTVCYTLTGHNRSFLTLWKTKDGVHYDFICKLGLDENDYPNEATVRFLPDDRMMILIRQDGDRNGASANGLLAVASAPYSEWTYTDIGFKIGGPELLVLGKDRLVIGGRDYVQGGNYTAIWTGPLEGPFEKVASLHEPVSDSSYPGFIVVGKELWCSYYRSYGDKKSDAAIYLAKIPLKTVK